MSWNFEIACLSYEWRACSRPATNPSSASAPISGDAQTLPTLTEDVSAVAARGALTSLPGIGRVRR